MSEDDAKTPPAADSKEEHATPGGNPAGGAHAAPEETETVVETPGGTTVTETPSEPQGAPGDLSGHSTVTENPRQHEGDVSHLSGRDGE